MERLLGCWRKDPYDPFLKVCDDQSDLLWVQLRFPFWPTPSAAQPSCLPSSLGFGHHRSGRENTVAPWGEAVSTRPGCERQGAKEDTK